MSACASILVPKVKQIKHQKYSEYILFVKDFLVQTCFTFVCLAISKTFPSDLALAEHDCRRLVPVGNTTLAVLGVKTPLYLQSIILAPLPGTSVERLC